GGKSRAGLCVCSQTRKDSGDRAGKPVQDNIGRGEKWNGPYLKESQLEDPWGNRYIYVAEGEMNPGSFDLVSLGADGEQGGEGDNEDIYND
ncbi:MAG: type II secretion system protein GspG, partial [Planctomycetota bacterium]